MDTPNRQVSWLQSFPPDIWAYFAWYLPGEQLGRFLMTGSIWVWQKLKSPSVVKSIKLGRDFMVFKSMPGFLKEFSSLNELSIYSCNSDWSRKLDLRPDSIPSGVRKLELIGLWDGPNLFQLNAYLPHLDVLHVQGITFESDWMAHSCPSSLTELHIGSWDFGVALPSSLTDFQVGSIIVSSDLFPKFPPLLESLVVGHSLSIPIWTLTELRKFGCSDFPCSKWYLLPPKLTALTLSAVSWPPLDVLPRSITSLELLGSHLCGLPAISNQSFFPPSLTSLKIANGQLSPETAKLLPSSLTFLAVGNLCEQVCQHLPSGLQTLKCSYVLFTPNLIKFLPKSLAYLDLKATSTSSMYHWFDYQTGKSIDISNLPEFPMQRACLQSSFNWKGVLLPPTITYFGLSKAYGTGDSFMSHQHLPNLLELRMTESKHFSDAFVPLISPHLMSLVLSHSSKISGESFKFLPRGLTQLELNSSDAIFDSDIQHLPRTLKHALLSTAIHLTELCIPDLPPRLESLNLKFNSKIPSSSFPRLPSSLRSSQGGTSVILLNWTVRFGILFSISGSGHRGWWW